MKIQFLLILFTITVFSNPTPPIWGGSSSFQVNINVTESNHTFQMIYQYDALINASIYNNIAPQYDSVCNTFGDAPSQYLTHNCSVVFARDTWFYINYFSDNWCCKCAQVGIVEPEWLKTDSTYKGQLTLNGYTCNWWTKKGFELNNYCSQIGTDLPVRYWESLTGTGPAIIQWDFLLPTYKQMTYDVNVFDAPKNCSLCAGTCSEFRNMTQTVQE